MMRQRNGFTLIEVMVSALIIGVMALAVSGSVSQYTDTAKTAKVYNDFRSLEAATLRYAMKNGALPSAMDVLNVALQEDSWGNPYLIEKVTTEGHDVVQLRSKGPDGVDSLDDMTKTICTEPSLVASWPGGGSGGETMASISGTVWDVGYDGGVFRFLRIGSSIKPDVPATVYGLPHEPIVDTRLNYGPSKPIAVYIDGVNQATLANGFFSISGLSVGTHTVELESGGFKSIPLTVNLATGENALDIPVLIGGNDFWNYLGDGWCGSDDTNLNY